MCISHHLEVLSDTTKQIGAIHKQKSLWTSFLLQFDTFPKLKKNTKKTQPTLILEYVR